MTYEELAAELAEFGVSETAVNLRNKVARGGFSTVILVQCLRVMRCRELRLAD